MSADLLLDGFGRVADVVADTVGGLSDHDLGVRLDPEANSVGWLVWHLSRVQDDQVAEVCDAKPVWQTGGWAERFDLPLDRADTGYGHETEQVDRVQVRGELLLGYHEAVGERTAVFLRGLNQADLERVVDDRQDPPVTLAVRLVSVLSETLQHAGQAAFVRGVLERRAD